MGSNDPPLETAPKPCSKRDTGFHRFSVAPMMEGTEQAYISTAYVDSCSLGVQ